MATYIRRREFIFTLGGTAASWPLSARAQQPAMPVVGFLHPGSLAMNKRNVAAFYQGLAEAGYTDGRNVRVEFRWADNQLGRLPMLAADLVASQVAVIVAAGAIGSPLAAKGATTTIPIVLVGVGDPIKRGLVASLNRPGGNVTGLTLVEHRASGQAARPRRPDGSASKGDCLPWQSFKLPGVRRTDERDTASGAGARA